MLAGLTLHARGSRRDTRTIASGPPYLDSSRSRVGDYFKMPVTNTSTGIFNRVTRIDLLVILILPLNIEIRVLQKAYGPLRSTE